MKKVYKQFQKSYPQKLIMDVVKISSKQKEIKELSTYPHL